MTESMMPGRGGVLVCDGATGTMLHAAGHPLDQHLPHLNLTDPDAVRTVHASYVDSGVDIVQTNTFGAGRIRLAGTGLADVTEQINRAGVQIARQVAVAAGREVLVAGSVSPAVTVHQRGTVPERDRHDALREQIEVLVSAGVDLIVLETFGHLDELVEAVDVAGGSGVPVIAEATFAEDRRTLSGHTVVDLVREIPAERVIALGTNCTLGPQGCLAVIRELARHTSVPLVAQPNAGLPRRVGPSRFEYVIDSAYLVRYVRQLLEVGVAVVGGCCGTTPGQIGAVADIVEDHRATHDATVSPFTARPGAPTGALLPADGGGSERFLVAAEFVPPAPGETATLVEEARALRRVGVDTIMVSASRAPRARGNTINLAVHLSDQAGVDPIVAVPTWDRTIMALQADLLGASVLGIRRIVCETGSPPLLGDYPSVDGVWEVDAAGLIGLLRGLNEGRDHHGVGLTAKTTFEIGTRVNLGRDDLDAAVRQARTEIEAGAGFVVTEPVHELGGLDRLLRELDPTTPILVRLQPLTTFEEADYLRHEVPDARVPDETVHALEQAGEHARSVGRRIARELAAGIAARAQGLVVCGDAVADTEFVADLIGVCRRAAAAGQRTQPDGTGGRIRSV